MSALQPPRINTSQDPTSAADLSESDDHFSSASEGGGGSGTGSPSHNPHRLSTPSTPITRVERVDDQPAYGEVPGTAAYALRTQDAVPDEIEVVPDGQRSRSHSHANSLRPSTPGGTPIPRTVVERVDDRPAYGEVEGTLARDMRMADALPDEVRRVLIPGKEERDVVEGREDESSLDEEQRQAWFRSMWESRGESQQQQAQTRRDEGAEGSGDDFDDFNIGDEDDFGDFDEAAEEEQPTPLAEHPPPPSFHPPPLTDVLAGLPPLNLSDPSPKATLEALSPYLTAIFPPTPSETVPPETTPPQATPFLSDRSLALWQQLVSPPPLQPPNWTRSRIRRLFLVSLGVPVDLDEILPPSKQKRLILPNIHLPRSGSTAAGGGVERLRSSGGGANDSSTSLDSKTGQPKVRRRRKGLQGPPDFDLNAAALVCGTTEAALRGMRDVELRTHVERLKVLNGRASEVLEYWLLRKDDAVNEKEVLEGVIENLVGFVKGRRGK